VKDSANPNVLQNLFTGDGQMCALIKAHDWSATSVGPVETWSPSLKTAIRIILGSRYPMFIWWGHDLTKFYNDAYIPILGKRHPHALGQPASVVWSEIWDIIGAQAEAVMTKGQASWNEELLLVMERNAYTEETYFTFSYSPVIDDSGEIQGVFCACTEDTRRVLGERRMRTLRELAAATTEAKTALAACQLSARALSQNSHDLPFALIYLLDETEPRARLMGTSGLALGTVASPEIVEIGDPTTDVWGFNSLTNPKSRFIDPIPQRFGLLPGGPWLTSPTRALVLPLAASGQDRLSGFFVAGITPRREFDDDYQGFLHLVAGQISTALANARAYEAERKRAEALAELDRAKTLFFSNVSHEFRTPLTLMLAPSEDALNDEHNFLPPTQRARIEIVQRNALRLLKLVNTLLDFSRIEAGRIQAVYEPTDLAKFTAEVASTFRSLIERAGMNLVVDCPLLPQPIYVDCQMWEKIILNLLSNAFKFTFSGTITVRLHSCGQYVELSVSDTGIGIPADEIPHLFERFHRVKGAHGRSFEGSGIGLSLVHELVKLHGGSVNVTSVLAQGSCFTISLPLGRAHLPPEQIGASRTLASTAMSSISYLEEARRWLPKQAGGSGGDGEQDFSSVVAPILSSSSIPSCARILIVDDNADMRDYLERLLSPRYEVEALEDGIAAIAAIRQRIPDLVLTDVMMPRLDGFRLLQLLRSEAQTQNLPIILLSARAGEESRIEGLEAGADDYLIKPFSARELLARVEAHLKMAQMRRQIEADLQQANALLEQKVQERTVQLSQANHSLHRLINILTATIHQQTKIEAQLSEAEHRWRCLLENVQLLVVGLDSNAAVVYVNPFFLELTGYTQAEVLGKSWLTTFIPPHQQPEVQTVFRQALEEELHLHYQNQILTKFGAQRTIAWNNTLLRDAKGQVIGTMSIGEDITQRQALEKIKNEFISVVSHELRTPMTSIQGGLNLLVTGLVKLDSQQARRILDIAADSAQRLVRLVNDILDLERLQSGKITLNKQPIHADELLRRSTELMHFSAIQSEITLSVLSPSIEFTADPDRLIQVFTNLLCNAIKFSPKKSTILLSAEPTHASDGHGAVLFKIQDHGRGIPADQIKFIFEPFHQVDASDSRKQGGTGLGLAIARNIVQQHDGLIWVESQLGFGSTFYILLPLGHHLTSTYSLGT